MSDIVTIACPVGMTHPDVMADAPIWLDAAGMQYRVASGIIPGVAATEWTAATTERVTIIVGVAGLDALAMMGLRRPPYSQFD